MKHSVIYHDPKMFAGWPANHGAWQWGDEFLFGFMRGAYDGDGYMHRIKQPFERVLVRSYNGGDSWVRQEGLPTFEGIHIKNDLPPMLDLQHDIIRVCGVYDTGGDNTDERGCYYQSPNKGRSWYGPYHFNGLELPEGEILTARTRTLGDLIFLSAGRRDVWGTDYTFVVRSTGDRFVKVGTVCADDARAVMPAVAKYGSNIVCLLRRRKTGKRSGWIDSFISRDEGATWQFMGFVGDTGSHNGNPPALLQMPDDTLWCAYGNRDAGEIRGARYSYSQKKWETWLIRKAESDRVDIGYPQMFLRKDGKAMVVYYWTSDQLPQQHIAMTIL
jgi:hypothetical protein